MSIFNAYLKSLEQALQQGDSTEHTHRPALKTLLEDAGSVKAVNEPKHVECGAPDFKITTDEKANPSVIGYIETKDIGKSLADAEKSGQLKRYRGSLPNLLLTDYTEFRWYIDGELRNSCSIGTVSSGGKIKKNPEGIKSLEEMLSAFFSHTPGPISKPEDLAERLARLTHMVRDLIEATFKQEKESNDLQDLRRAFAEVLIPDIDKEEKISEFADMYAQTIAYGLFAARCNHHTAEPFTRLSAASEIPKTNPFLRELFDMITSVKLEDEPYAGFVDDIADLLSKTDISAVLEHFGKKKKSEDPIIHFYETFLAAYDSKLRKIRGVYYTPEPVISYIIRSVDHILRERFGLKDGLADTSKIKYEKRTSTGETETAESHRVLILDPATGTGSFLYHVIGLIRSRFMEKGNAGMWSGYVREHLLPRLFGFELLMAPYAVAHLKLGMQLAGQDLPSDELRKNWAYDFEGNERLKIFLTNTLEEADRTIQTELYGPMRIISEEANAAIEVKNELPIMVIIGNPPYSGHSANDGEWIKKLVQDEYYPRDDIKERNPKWLLDDYVKFIRWAQWRIEKTGSGILAFITNHSYIDNPTFRQMRKSLLGTFDEMYIHDLHGNVKKKETAPDGSKDENVFDIQQGVAVCVMIKNKSLKNRVNHADSFGSRNAKYKSLRESDLMSKKYEKIDPVKPFYFLKPYNTELLSEYDLFFPINTIFPINGVGMTTARDHIVIDFTDEPIIENAKTFRDSPLSDEEVCKLLKIPLKKGWNIKRARELIQEIEIIENEIKDVLYRPFDNRRIFYHDSLVWRTVKKVMRHMLEGENIGLIARRQMIGNNISYFFISNKIVSDGVIRSDNKGGESLFPLYMIKDKEEQSGQLNLSEKNNSSKVPNLDEKFIEDFSSRLGLEFIPEGVGDKQKTFGPEDILHYIYALFYSPTYRERYAEFLKIDFPRVPLTSDRGLFASLCALGAELTGLHLLDSVSESDIETSFPVKGTDEVAKGHPKFHAAGSLSPETGEALEKGRVYINKEQYFDGVDRDVWEFHVGGYQVPEKWLKDRRGRTLSYDEKMHYQKVLYSLGRTIALMKKIDETIPSWPIE